MLPLAKQDKEYMRSVLFLTITFESIILLKKKFNLKSSTGKNDKKHNKQNKTCYHDIYPFMVRPDIK